MNILIEKNVKLKKIVSIIDEMKDISYVIDTKRVIVSNANLYDICIIFCNTIKGIDYFKKIKERNIIAFTDNLDDKFIYDIIHAIHPQDMININNSNDSIKQRLNAMMCNFERA